MNDLAFCTKKPPSVQGLFCACCIFSRDFETVLRRSQRVACLTSFRTFGKLCHAQTFFVFSCAHAVKLPAGITVYPFRDMSPFFRRIG